MTTPSSDGGVGRHGPELRRAIDALAAAERVAVLTGAGVSAASGLATFRGPDGLWRGRDPTSLATPGAFARDPELVWAFYRDRLAALAPAAPNAAHRALVRLASTRRVDIATQNVDGLHQAAGSTRVHELHGSLRRARCTACGARSALAAPLPETPRVPACPLCAGPLRPDVVWFGETLPARPFERAMEAFAGCDVALVVGTSGVVFPAAGLADLAAESGATRIEVNPDASSLAADADVALPLPAEVALPRIVAAVLGAGSAVAQGARPDAVADADPEPGADADADADPEPDADADAAATISATADGPGDAAANADADDRDAP